MTIKIYFTTTFINKGIQEATTSSNNKILNSIPYKIALKIITFMITNRIFLYLTFSHLFTLVHELGHALAYKMITKKGSTITMSPLHCIGQTIPDESSRYLTSFQIIFISLAGHLSTIVFSSLIILGIFSLTHYIVMPLGLIIALRIIISFPVIIRFLLECFYIVLSLYQSSGDFGLIKKEGGFLAVIISIAILISFLALFLIGIVVWF